ncbi:MAG: hypothetical protein DYH13_00880 [Alphaproteobacteria bacterium PRO2]|nr:hypothetical protein [Alphaproteobacteria bacterium PRO2]
MPSILDGSSGTALSILDAARTSYRGIGLSQRARALTSSYLDQSVNGLNTILSLNVAGNASIESVQMKIKAIRASVPQSQLLESLREDNGNAAGSANGRNVDTEA